MFLLLLQLATQTTAAGPHPVYNGRTGQLAVSIPRVDTAARVDGVLDEAVWRSAALLTGFSQYRPSDGRPAVDSTEVLVWYAPDAIWFGIRAFEAHGIQAVRATLAQRDNIGNDDNIQILLDTYDDHRRALIFAVNPLGVQQDGVRSEGQDAGSAGGPQAGGRFDGIIDINPDYVYESKGQLTDWGYEVEVRVPFKSLRYQSADPQAWALQIIRVTQHSAYEDTWTPAVRANASFLIQSGRLEGLTGLHRGLVMDLTPEFTTRVPGDSGASGWGYSANPELGGTARWGVTQNLGLNATVNPDFSQVEADVGQVTVNERFALFYPEKRPFFLDGLENFDTPNRLIYTRQVTQPDGAAKLVGKVGSTNLAYLGALDDRSASVSGPRPLYNLLRVRSDLGASSTLGLVYTGRTEGNLVDGQYNRVLGADARVIWGKIWFSSAQVAGSWTTGGPAFGELWSVTFADRTGRAYGNHFELAGISPDFVAASGFVPRTDVVEARLFNRFSWYGAPGAGVEAVTTFVGIDPVWRYRDFFDGKGTVEGSLSDNVTVTLRGGWSVNGRAALSHQRFDAASYADYYVQQPADTVAFTVPHGLYNLPDGNVGIESPNRALKLSAAVGLAATPIFAEAARGTSFAAQLEAAWRPTAALRVEARWVHQQITRSRDGSRFSTANIPRLKIEYQLSRAIFFRYVGQYIAQDRAALVDPGTGEPLLSCTGGSCTPLGPEVSNDLRNDLLFSFNPVPGTVLFAGYGASLTESAAFQFQNLQRTADGFFFKLSYLFRL